MESYRQKIRNNAMASLKIKYEEFRLVHLSDLHFTGRPVTEFSSNFWQYFDLDAISEINLRILLDDIVSIDPHHIFITGDVTNTAHPLEFAKAKAWLLQLQHKLRPSLPHGTMQLSPELFSIIPGNHDVAKNPSRFSRKKAENSKLKLFMDAFGSTINISDLIYDYNEAFPTHKKLFDSVDVFCLNSTVNIPVHVVGANATGEIGKTQRIRLVEQFNTHRTNEGHYRIVLCHHHPLSIPYKQSMDLVEDFMVMRDARNLLRVCFEFGVHLFLHGHKHTPFVWTNQVIPELDPPHQMNVVCAGSPTHQISGSSQVYNRYMVLRRQLGTEFVVEKVEMQTRRYNPNRRQFEDLPALSLYQSPNQDQNASDDNRRRD